MDTGEYPVDSLLNMLFMSTGPLTYLFTYAEVGYLQDPFHRAQQSRRHVQSDGHRLAH